MTDTFVCEIPLPPAGIGKKREPIERRTGSKVRRESVLAGRERGVAIDGRQKAATLRLYDEQARAKKLPGQRWGHKGTPSRHDRMILDYLLFLAVKEAGRVYPTLRAIAADVGCTTRSVVAGLKRLKAAGFLRWDRRYVETGAKGLRGPQVEQTSNFYYLVIKKAAQQLLDAWTASAARKRQTDAERAEAAALQAAQRQQAIKAKFEDSMRGSPGYQRALAKAAGAASAAAPGDTS